MDFKKSISSSCIHFRQGVRDTFSLAATSVVCEDAATPFCCEASAMICGLWVDNDRFLLIFWCIYPLKMVTQIQIENLLKKKKQTQIPLRAAFMKEFAPFQYHLARCTFNGEEILSHVEISQ